MTKVYEVTRSYTTCDVHVVKANNEEEAKKKVVVLGEYITHKSYDSDYDDEVAVWEVTDKGMNVYKMNKQELIDNKIALPIMWASTANINNDNDVEMDDYIDCTDTLTLRVLKCPVDDIGFEFVMVVDPAKEYTERTGWMVMSDVEEWNTQHQYCEERIEEE